jgi:hypothetical protein
VKYKVKVYLQLACADGLLPGWRYTPSFPTASSDCGTVSGWPSTAQDFTQRLYGCHRDLGLDQLNRNITSSAMDVSTPPCEAGYRNIIVPLTAAGSIMVSSVTMDIELQCASLLPECAMTPCQRPRRLAVLPSMPNW